MGNCHVNLLHFFNIFCHYHSFFFKKEAMNCIFCSLDCMGTCEEWETLTVEWEILTTEIIDGIYDDFLHELAGVKKKGMRKRKREYKNREELKQSKRISMKCLECRYDRKKCDGIPNEKRCSRCSVTTYKVCSFDARIP